MVTVRGSTATTPERVVAVPALTAAAPVMLAMPPPYVQPTALVSHRVRV
jgi:hypothetical protein